jgi:uridine phosphorylase
VTSRIPKPDLSSPSPGLPPLLDHPHDEPSEFRPEDLVDAVRGQRGLAASSLPEVCILDFDGDLTDALVESGELDRCREWPCFHTAMWSFEVDGRRCGLIDRTIGGPYAVLVAEQLAVCGVKVAVGVTSAGRIGTKLPVPGIVVAERAVRDEGTSYHYLPPGETVEAPPGMADALGPELEAAGLPVLRGLVWTTDAPYRETAEQIARYAARGALAVEMQAASLFAFAAARKFPVGIIAHVTNAPEQGEEQFDKGTHDLQRELLHAACRGARRYLEGRA